MHQSIVRSRLLSFSLLAPLGVLVACAPEADDASSWREADDSPPPGDDDPLPPMDVTELAGMSVVELQAMPSLATVQYQMVPLPSATYPFSDPIITNTTTGWPAHALQWKDYVSTPSFDLVAAQTEIQALFGLGSSVDTFDSDLLDDLEATTTVFGSDPSGEWQEEVFSDPAEGFVFAALVMHYWGSPVYKGAVHRYPNTPLAACTLSHSLVLETLEFSIPSAADLHAACGLSPNADPATALTTILSCSHGAVLTSNQISLWNEGPMGCQPYSEHVANTTIPVHELVDAYNSGPTSGPLVFDPPAEVTAEDVDGLRVLAAALADQVLIPDADGVLVPLRSYEPSGEG